MQPTLFGGYQLHPSFVSGLWVKKELPYKDKLSEGSIKIHQHDALVVTRMPHGIGPWNKLFSVAVQS